MELITLNADQVITIGIWVVGGFLGLLLIIVTHIGNAGSAMKKQLGDHGERISRVEVGIDSLNGSAHRIEDKMDRIIEQKNK